MKCFTLHLDTKFVRRATLNQYNHILYQPFSIISLVNILAHSVNIMTHPWYICTYIRTYSLLHIYYSKHFLPFDTHIHYYETVLHVLKWFELNCRLWFKFHSHSASNLPVLNNHIRVFFEINRRCYEISVCYKHHIY